MAVWIGLTLLILLDVAAWLRGSDSLWAGLAAVEQILAEAAEPDLVASRPVTHRTVGPGLSVFSVRRGSDQGEVE